MPSDRVSNSCKHAFRKLTPDVGFEARDFFHQFPRSPGIFHFSRPGFSADGSQALLLAFRNDDLDSECRPQNHPTDSAHFHQLCFYQRYTGDWKLVGFTDWTKLVNHEQFMARGERARKKHLEDQLLAGGWRILESEPERLRLANLSESSVTVVTDRYLIKRLNENERDSSGSRFYICPDPVLIVPWIDASKILEKLK